MENLVKMLTPKNMGEKFIINIEDFILAYNENKVVVLDVRASFERDIWQLNFGLNIPANELPNRLDELPKDKIIVCTCPLADRSIIASLYLQSIGLESRYLKGGMLDLITRLKGSKAKDLNI